VFITAPLASHAFHLCVDLRLGLPSTLSGVESSVCCPRAQVRLALGRSIGLVDARSSNGNHSSLPQVRYRDTPHGLVARLSARRLSSFTAPISASLAGNSLHPKHGVAGESSRTVVSPPGQSTRTEVLPHSRVCPLTQRSHHSGGPLACRSTPSVHYALAMLSSTARSVSFTLPSPTRDAHPSPSRDHGSGIRRHRVDKHESRARSDGLAGPRPSSQSSDYLTRALDYWLRARLTVVRPTRSRYRLLTVGMSRCRPTYSLT